MPRKSTASVSAPPEASTSDATVRPPTTPSHAHPDPQEKPSDPASKPSPKPARQSKGGAGKHDDVGIDELLLPRTLISRLARGVLPPNTSLQRDALLAITRSATVFVSYLASHANEQTSRKTIAAADVVAALAEIEMAGVMEVGKPGRVEREVEVYEGVQREKRRGWREKGKSKEGEGEGDEEGDERRSKKARRSQEADAEVEAEEDDDDEERMLDAQLNGGVPGEGEGEGEGDEDDEEGDEESGGSDQEAEPGREPLEDRVDVEERNGHAHAHGGLMPNGRVEVGSEDESD